MSRITRRSLVGGALLLPVAGIAGRVAFASQSGDSTSSTPDASPSASPAASPMATPEAGGEVIEVDAIDIDFSIKEIKAQADTDVTIKLVNKGVLEHDLHIDQLDITTELLKPGEEDEIVVNAPAGEYDYWCTVAGHKEAGMTGVLILE